VLFYDLASALKTPIILLEIHRGGMSFHGGLVGVIIATYIYCRNHLLCLLTTADIIAASAPAGIFFGRIGNYANHEIYGPPTTAWWGVIFPDSGGFPRHPTQLYEAATEGLLPFSILILL
jgi:phosphatidylglycerol:prolipoprotein diacylglycerol transferase